MGSMQAVSGSLQSDRSDQEEGRCVRMDDRSNRWIVLILVLALLYIISPVDFIPDPIPVVGLVDDALVGIGAGAACLKS